MIQRVKQFYRAISAKLSVADRKFIEEKLPPAALHLFYAMHPADQYHALRVTRTAITLSEYAPAAGDRALLIRAALLHDVGRVKGDLDIWGKVWAVLFNRLLPQWSRDRAAARNTGNYISRILYIYYNHPEIGAEKLTEIGLLREAEIIRRHHAAPREDDSWELAILRQADDLN